MLIDLFTDTAAILNLLYLSSIMGCPGGISSKIRYTHSVYVRALFGPVFLQVFLEKDCNGKKLKKYRCAVFGCNDERLFPGKYTVRSRTGS